MAIVVGVLVSIWVMHVGTDPEGLWLTVEAPDSVQMGETFKLVVKATNRSLDRDIKLGDLDITDDYLKGFAIVSISPSPKSNEIDTFNDCTTMRFETTVPPGETAEFQFDLRAELSGRHRGQIDQYVGMQFVSTVMQTTVRR
ncbi:MAG: hypothetical protein KAH56_09970 [Candidatus Krumholzibacteria bacterium]|nr:hypothetical protein [Candidatus Krumholzibacteria bacterium]